MPALIWPLLDKLCRPTAFQRRPTARANQSVTLPPTFPWDGRPGSAVFGQVEGDPQLWNVAPWNFGLAAIGVQSVELKSFPTNPRAHPVSEQRRVPAPVRPPPLWQVIPPAPPPRDDRQTRRIIWPLRAKLSPLVGGLVGAQQKPTAVSQRAVPVLPWSKRSRPSPIRPTNLPARVAMLSGVTRDSTGAALGNCVVELYLTATDEALSKTTSDASGAFTFTCARYSPATHYLVAYKAGGTDVAGTTVNTLVGVG